MKFDFKRLLLFFIAITLLFAIQCNADDPASGGSQGSGQTLVAKTGQTTSYGTDDDGALQRGVTWPTPRFVDNGNGTITDGLTGLLWQKAPLAVARQWSQAVTYCNDLILAGYTDWRLPNVLELESLVNIGQANSSTWLNSQGFSGVLDDVYWTSTTFADNTNCAWRIYFKNYGTLAYENKTSYSNYVLAVRTGQAGVVSLSKTGQTESFASGDDGALQCGVSAPNPRFTDNGNGTIKDNLTGLLWEKGPVSTTYQWTGALDYCNSLTLAGYTDWRLPNRRELLSLVNFGNSNPSTWLNLQGFSYIQSGDYYWTSSTYADSTGMGWALNFRYGWVDGAINYKTYDYYVVAVREE